LLFQESKLPIDLKTLYKRKTVAVTGANGYIGSSLVYSLLQIGAKVIRVSRKPLVSIEGSENFVSDTSLPQCWRYLVQRSDIIIHLAGNTSIYSANNDPVASIKSTLDPITHLVKAAKDLNKNPRVVFASSVSIYGIKPKLPVNEKAIIETNNFYDLHKYFAELQLKVAGKKGILEPIVLRLSNVYGPSKSEVAAPDRGILNKIAQNSLLGLPISIYGNGKFTRDYIYISDVIDAFIIAGVSNNLSGECYNIASGKGIFIRDLFLKIADKATKFTTNISEIKYINPPKEIDSSDLRNFYADIKAFKNATGWSPNIDLNLGLDKLFQSLLNKSQKKVIC